jgi:hypothetical protein
MLKTNSKQARENIRNYIINRFDCSDYEPEIIPEGFTEIAKFILTTFRDEKTNYQNIPEVDLFADWAAGLPAVLDTCYYYNRSAVNDLGKILNETQAEKDKYSEDKARELLSSLIYRELLKGGC